MFRHTSITKKGKSFVIYRNNNNEKVFSLEELRRSLIKSGYSPNYFHSITFRSDKEPAVASDKVGAAKIARQEASDWVREVQERAQAESF